MRYYHITAVLKNGLNISSTNFKAENREDAYLDFIKRNRRDIENIISITVVEREDIKV